ncbi:MAG: thiolase family protein [Eubacterium sp.]|nr:thiolase family protein [Eubacterium sp.]
MSFNDNIPKLQPFKRSVSIIGVGATPFVRVMDDPECDGLTEGELFGYAARDAMKDAGVSGKDIDFFIHGQAGPGWISNFGTANIHVANWLGMKGKGSMHQSEACATGYVALETAVSYVASGMYDVVLSGCIDMPYSIAHPTRVLTKRRFGTDSMFHEVLCSTVTRDYNLFTRGVLPFSSESWLDHYYKENNVSPEDIDKTMTNMAINCRRAAALNPLGLFDDNFEDLAHKYGMETAEEYLHSKYNPLIGKYMRACHFEQRCDGAAAVIVCPTEMAHKYTDHWVEVLGIGHSCVEYNTPELERIATRNAYQQVRDLTGLTGADMDLFLTNDFFMQSEMLAAEQCEYLPKGQGWKYMLEGRAAFDGDRPVQPHGGRCQYGHASSASGLHDLYEAVLQMRGERGTTQVKNKIDYTMIRGFGGGQNVLVTMLKNSGKGGN